MKLRYCPPLLLFLFVLTATPPPVHSEEPSRSGGSNPSQPSDFGGEGFTMTLGAGAGRTWTDAKTTSRIGVNSLAVFDLSLGFFASDRIALLFGPQAAAAEDIRGPRLLQYTDASWSLRAQFWLDSRWSLEAGIARSAHSMEFDEIDNVETSTGNGVNLALSWAITRSSQHAHHLSLVWWRSDYDGDLLDGASAVALLYRWQKL